jgi:hypothetical protein
MPNFESLFNSPISQARSKIVDDAVKIEFLINIILSLGLGLGPTGSISFGNTGAALSFMQKVQLLIDFKKFKKREDPAKFKIFMEMRNQFAHNLSVMTLDKIRPSNIKWLRDNYQKNTGEHTELDHLYSLFIKDIMNILDDLLELLSTKSSENSLNKVKSGLLDMVIAELITISKNDTDFTAKLDPILMALQDEIEKLDIKNDSMKSNFL